MAPALTGLPKTFPSLLLFPTTHVKSTNEGRFWGLGQPSRFYPHPIPLWGVEGPKWNREGTEEKQESWLFLRAGEDTSTQDLDERVPRP